MKVLQLKQKICVQELSVASVTCTAVMQIFKWPLSNIFWSHFSLFITMFFVIWNVFCLIFERTKIKVSDKKGVQYYLLNEPFWTVWGVLLSSAVSVFCPPHHCQSSVLNLILHYLCHSWHWHFELSRLENFLNYILPSHISHFIYIKC